jgi:hypothetical protein
MWMLSSMDLWKMGKLERSFDHVISFAPYPSISTQDILIRVMRSKVVPCWAWVGPLVCCFIPSSWLLSAKSWKNKGMKYLRTRVLNARSARKNIIAAAVIGWRRVHEMKGPSKLRLSPNLLLNWVSCPVFMPCWSPVYSFLPGFFGGNLIPCVTNSGFFRCRVFSWLYGYLDCPYKRLSTTHRSRSFFCRTHRSFLQKFITFNIETQPSASAHRFLLHPSPAPNSSKLFPRLTRFFCLIDWHRTSMGSPTRHFTFRVSKSPVQVQRLVYSTIDKFVSRTTTASYSSH